MGKVTLDLERRAPGKPVPPPPKDLYAKRAQIYPKLAHGKFRMVKWIVMAATLGVYYLVPWIRWDRGAGAPDQAVLADFAGERFYFFFIEIWPQEIYYLTGLLILAALGLFLVTSLFGRVWCGYTCPQTVWTDLFIWVERAFEGDRAARMRLDKAKLSFNKLWRKTGKHLVWILISFLTGGAFILYWHDAPTIAETFFIGQAPLSAYWFAAILTGTTYFLAGAMREQVCTYMCPWPRIQGALTDEHALNVTYRYTRGEPRAPMRKDTDWSTRGDCIDCDQCVQVCPMGINIRDGAQLECIHCALCIDACDQMMDKIGRPRGLIAYDTDHAVDAVARGEAPKYTFFRARTILYSSLMLFIAGLMSFGLSTRASFEINTLKDRSPPFVQLADGSLRNGYTLKLVNKTPDVRTMRIETSGLADAEIEIIGLEADGSEAVLPVAANGVDRFRILVTVPPGAIERRGQIIFTVTDTETGESYTNRVSFRGP
ncbi:MAG: cytochrome c oxidase accessory protein CcoG [Pseudomonadota bacterium]